MWHRVAFHLGRTVPEAQASMTSTEFVKWVRFLDWRDVEEFRREDFYLAQIAAAVERGHVKHPAKITVQSKILKFTSQDSPKDPGKDVKESKAFWLSLARVRGDTEDHQGDDPLSGGVNTQGSTHRQKEHGGDVAGGMRRRE